MGFWEGLLKGELRAESIPRTGEAKEWRRGEGRPQERVGTQAQDVRVRHTPVGACVGPSA